MKQPAILGIFSENVVAVVRGIPIHKRMSRIEMEAIQCQKRAAYTA